MRQLIRRKLTDNDDVRDGHADDAEARKRNGSGEPKQVGDVWACRSHEMGRRL
jgi:hypothetical protein